MPSHIEEKQSGSQEPKAQPNGQEMQAVWMEYKKSGTPELRNQLIEYYFPLVGRIADRLSVKLGYSFDIRDLKSAGVFGLMDAIDAYDPMRGTPFDSFCWYRIQGSMLDEIRKMSGVPRLATDSYNLVKDVRMKLFPLLGHNPTDEEIMDELDLDIVEFSKLQHEATIPQVQSLHQELFATKRRMLFTLTDGFEDKRAESPDAREERADSFRRLLRGFNRQERLLIILYYYEGLKMEEVGEHLGLTTSGVSLMHKGLKERLLNKLVAIRTQEESISAPRPIYDKFWGSVVDKIIAAIVETRGGYSATISLSA